MSEITCTVLKNPFNTTGREIHKINYIPGKTVQQYVQPYTMGLDDFIYSANGKKVEPDHVPGPGDYIAVCPVVGKSKWLGSILSLGLAVWTGNLASKGFWGLKAGSFAAGLAASAIAYIGGQIINHLFPPAKPDLSSSSSTPTYGWGPITPQITQGGVLARTYGTMVTAGTELSRDITVNGDKQYLNVLYTGGQGPIDEITDIKINGNPIENYKGVQVDIRLGTNDQDVIPNFADTSANQSLSYELQEDTWSTHVTEGNAGQGLRIDVEFPNGLYHINSKGKLKNAWVKLVSEYRLVGTVKWKPWLGSAYVSSSSIAGATCYPDAPGETWTITRIRLGGDEKTFAKGTVSGDTYDLDTSDGFFDNGKIRFKVPEQRGTYTIVVRNDSQISAAQNTAVRRSFRIDNIPAGRYEVRVKVAARSAAVTSTRDSVRVYWTQLSHIIYDDLCRPNKVLIGIRALATDQLNGSDITVTWQQHKNTVWVWNPATGQYEEKSARNPAWVCYDMIHGARRLKNINTGEYEFVVDNVPASQIVYQAFADWAAHIDTLGIEFEHMFTDATDLWTALKIPETFGRGKVIMLGTKFSCICDKPSTPVQMFTVGNIIQGSFSKEFLGLADRANAVEITFVNRDKGYERDCITVYGDDYNEENMLLNPTQITLDGCTSYQQAYQYGKYLLRCNKLLLRTVTWDADVDAIACQIGDQVLIQHDVPEWGFGGRILDASLNSLVVDREITLEPGKTYEVMVRMADDSLVKKTVVQSTTAFLSPGFVIDIPGETNETTVTSTLFIDGTFDEMPQKYDLYTFGEINKSAKPFVIVDIERKDDLTFTLTGIEYVPAVYEESLDAPVIDYTSYDTTTPEVTNLNVAQETYIQKDGTVVSVIHCSWTMPKKSVRGAIVYYRPEGSEAWQKWDSLQDNFTTITGVTALETYQVKVCTIGELGTVSNGVIEPIYITGKDQPPSDVPNLTATIDSTDRTKIRLSWTAVDDVDLAGYRIMEGNTVIEPCYQGVSYIYTASVSKQYIFKIYAVDNSGNLSVNPATATLDVVVEPNTVTGFTGTIQETDRSKIVFSWQPNSEQDISHYEIREGTNWNTSTVIASQLKATTYTHPLTSEGYKTFLIKAVNLAGKYSANASSCSLQITLRPDAPTNFQAQQEPKDRSLLKLSWDASSGKDIAGYEIRKGTNWDTAEYVTFTRETTYWYSAQNSGSYNFMIKAKTVAGYLSNAANTSITVIIEPYDVTGFTAVQMIDNRTKVRLMWDPPISLDVAYFEIRKGVSWDAGQVIGQRVTGTFYDIIVPDETIQTFWIKTVSVAGNYSQNAATIEGIFNLNPAPVSNIQISQDPNDKSILNITWEATPESDLAFYEIRIGYTWETATKIGETKELRWTYRLTQTGDVKVIIKAKNAAEYYSDEAFNRYYAVLEPQDVTGFQVIQNGEYVEMYWDKATEPDVVAYEIREGASFEQGSLIASGVTVNEYNVKVDTERVYYYHIKAINRSLHYSLNAANAMVAVQNLPPKNIIQTYDEIALQSGTHSNTEFGKSLINWQTIGGKWSDYPNTKFGDVGGQTVLKLKRTEADPTFTRNSVAYKSDGTQVAANVPRIDGGIMVEEGTTNGISYAFTSDTNLLQYFTDTHSGSSVTIDNTQTPPVSGQKVVKHYTGIDDSYIEAKDANSVAYITASTAKLAVTGGTYVTLSIWAKGQNGGEQIEIFIFDYASDTGVHRVRKSQLFTITNTFQRYVVTAQTASDAVRAWARVDNNLAGQTVYWCAPQLEVKAYATSFTPSTRSPETLTIPTAGVLNPQEGTIEFWTYVDAQVRDTSRVRRFFSHLNGAGHANRITIQHNNSPHWIFVIADNAGNTHSLNGGDSYTPDGWHYFAMVWNSTRFAVFIDGVKRGEVLNPVYLPQSLASTFDIGHTLGGFQCNSLIKNLRISSRARTDEEITSAYTNGVTIDADTTYFAPFTQNALSVPLYRNQNGTYTPIRKDIGQVITANITTDFRSSVVLRGTGSAKLQMRTSRDGVNWTNWQDFRPAQYTFRYADFRVLLGTSDISKTPEVNHCEIRIDVPDVEKTGTITVPIGGTTVSYGHTFYTVPVITPTAIGNNKFPQVIAKTNTDFTVKIVDRNGNDVGGQLDWRVRGY